MKSKSVSNLNRRSLRLPEYDYSWPGYYFVTMSTHKQMGIFGCVAEGIVELNAFGKIANDLWSEIPIHFSHVDLDASIVMPNHVHGILYFGGTGTACRAPTNERFSKPTAGTLPTVIRSYKSVVTKEVNLQRNTPGAAIWQRNYYEHIIRDNDSLHELRRYIDENPLRWSLNKEDIHNA